MTLTAFVRYARAELEAAELAFMCQLGLYTWSGVGAAPWIRARLKRMVGEADARSMPRDWVRIVADLRSRGYTGALPRSLRRYEPVGHAWQDLHPPETTGLLASPRIRAIPSR